MTKSTYDFQRLLQKMAKLSYVEVLQEAEKECASVERTLSKVKGAPRNREQGAEVHCSQIKEFLFFMRTGTRPGSVSSMNFQTYKPIVQSLISRGEFAVETLALFP